MASPSSKLLRRVSSTVGIYVRLQAPSGNWYRAAEVPQVDQYFSNVVAPRVEEESAKQIAEARRKYPNRIVTRIVIELGFHDSPNDPVFHAQVSLEDDNEDHVTRKHVAQKKEEQTLSDQKK